VDWQFVENSQQQWRLDKPDYWYEISQRIVACAIIEMRILRQSANVGDDQRSAIRGTLGSSLHSYIASSTWPIVDDDHLAQGVTKLVCGPARADIAWASRRPGGNNPDWSQGVRFACCGIDLHQADKQ
jgi:hypothetical protein